MQGRNVLINTMIYPHGGLPYNSGYCERGVDTTLIFVIIEWRS